MSGGGRGKRPKSGLTAEEQLLWEHTARSMKPLRTAKSRVLDGADEAALEPVDVAPKRRAKADKAAAPLPGLPAAPAAAAKKPAKTPELADFDRKAAKRLRGGRIEIEARLDLHGMREHEAHAELRRFLYSCQASGKRWVLVITGKGAPRRTGWFGDDGEPHVAQSDRGQGPDFGRDDPYGGAASQRRGVIRRSVPRWLAEPDLRAIVVSYTQAAIQHGGEGAMYVQLRKR